METTNKKAEVVRLFSEISKVIKHNMRHDFRNLGITIPQGIVIGTLMKFGEMKISELSRKVNLSNSTISGIIDRLEKQQLVVRTRSAKDRRLVYVNVTPKVDELFKGVHKKAEEMFADLLGTGTAAEFEKIIEGLSLLKNIMNDRHPEP